LFTKAGWTPSDGRAEAAIVTMHNKGSYVLVLIANEQIYAESEDVYPQFSATIYRLMATRAENKSKKN